MRKSFIYFNTHKPRCYAYYESLLAFQVAGELATSFAMYV